MLLPLVPLSPKTVSSASDKALSLSHLSHTGTGKPSGTGGMRVESARHVLPVREEVGCGLPQHPYLWSHPRITVWITVNPWLDLVHLVLEMEPEGSSPDFWLHPGCCKCTAKKWKVRSALAPMLLLLQLPHCRLWNDVYMWKKTPHQAVCLWALS